MNSACTWWVLARQIVSELSINSTQTHWVNAPLPPVCACAVANEEDGPIDIWTNEERDRHISRTKTRPETTVAPGWEQYPSAYVVRPTLTSAR